MGSVLYIVWIVGTFLSIIVAVLLSLRHMSSKHSDELLMKPKDDESSEFDRKF